VQDSKALIATYRNDKFYVEGARALTTGQPYSLCKHKPLRLSEILNINQNVINSIARGENSMGL